MTKDQKQRIPEGFKRWKSPSGIVMVTPDMRTKKGKAMYRKACEIISSPSSQ